MTFGSLFSGIGGFDLGLERAGMECLWQVEIDPYCRKVLAKHWPDVPRHEDVKDVGAHNLEPVDLICGGFPCQDISYAGRGAGLAGERSGLWYEFARIVRELGPRYVLVENVAALTFRGLGAVLGSLSEIGYDAEWATLGAAHLGASHLRERVFILAHPAGERLNALAPEGGVLPKSGSRWAGREVIPRKGASGRVWATPVGGIHRVADGFPTELDKSAASGLGNAVVPQVAEWIGTRLMSTGADA